jgi:putative transposase
LNKLAHELVQRYDGIALEDLHITNLVRNKRLSKSILDSGWGYFKERLTIKAANAGREIAFVNPAYTSRDCSRCAYRNPILRLADRSWVCPNCHTTHDRDVNAAINILKQSRLDESVKPNVAPLLAGLDLTGKRKRASEAHLL